jgi:hypothetical protein
MAKKVKPQVQQKEQTQLKEQADKFLAVVPEEHVFWCHDGRIFKSLKDMAQGLGIMSDDTFAYHVNSEKNDFSKWVREVIKDEKLASDLAAVTSRMQAAECVTARLTGLLNKVA